MNKNSKDKEIDLDILRYLSKSPNASQREIANRMGLSLGKINFLIKALIKKGLIKIENFLKTNQKSNIFISSHLRS